MTENEEVMILENLRPGCGEKLSFSEGEICETIDTAITALKEIQQYREIGTVEDCREAVEKQKPKKPHRNYKKFSGLWCKCGWYLGQKQCLDIKYCPNCGQAIDENLEGMEDERD